MRLSRVLALLGLLLLGCVMLTSCGGSGTKPAPPAALMITTTALPQGTVNNPYNYNLTASGGSGTYTWCIVETSGTCDNGAGVLPPGLTINTMTSFINGSPTAAGTFGFTARVNDSAGDSANANLSISVNGALQLTCIGCGAGSMNLPAGNPGVPYNVTAFSVTGGQAPYSWCVVESNGSCDSGSGGALPPGLTISTVNNNGVISGTPTTPGTPTSFTVMASDSETIPAHGSTAAVITIFAISTTPGLPAGTLDEPYLTSMGGPVDVVAIGGAPPFTWSMTAGSLPPGLTFGPCIKSTRPICPITGIPTQLGTSTFTLQVADGETPPAVATAQLSITVGSSVGNGTLNGTYAFTFTGYNGGVPFIMAGSLMADGMGNITSGKVDFNNGSGETNEPSQCLGNPVCPIPQTVQTGSVYNLSSGNGLGSMTIMTLDSANNPHTYVFAIAVNGNACTASSSKSACGTLIQWDPSNPQSYGSGFLKVQDPAFFTVNGFFPGNFALLLNGIDPAGNRYAAVGALGFNPSTRVDIDCSGNGWGLSGCPLQTNDDGTPNPDPTAGTFSSTLDPTTGRGEFANIAFPSDPNGYCLGPTHNGQSCGYAYYVVNKAEMILISTDPLSKPADMTLWSAYRQESIATGWTLQELSGNTVMELTGIGNTNSDIIAGILNCPATSAGCGTGGAGGASFSGDENDAGTLTQQSSQGTLAAVITTGSDKDLTGFFTTSGFSQPSLSGGSLFLYSGNTGYYVGADAKVTSGVVELQSGGPYTAGSVVGSYQGGSEWPAGTGITNSVTSIFADGSGNITAIQETSGPTGIVGPNNLSLTYQVSSSGRGTVMQGANEFGVLYIVGPNKFVLVPAGNNQALGIYISGQPD